LLGSYHNSVRIIIYARIWFGYWLSWKWIYLCYRNSITIFTTTYIWRILKRIVRSMRFSIFSSSLFRPRRRIFLYSNYCATITAVTSLHLKANFSSKQHEPLDSSTHFKIKYNSHGTNIWTKLTDWLFLYSTYMNHRILLMNFNPI